MTIRHLNRSRRARQTKRRACTCDWCFTNKERRRRIVTGPAEIKMEVSK